MKKGYVALLQRDKSDVVQCRLTGFGVAVLVVDASSTYRFWVHRFSLNQVDTARAPYALPTARAGTRIREQIKTTSIRLQAVRASEIERLQHKKPPSTMWRREVTEGGLRGRRWGACNQSAVFGCADGDDATVTQTDDRVDIPYANSKGVVDPTWE